MRVTREITPWRGCWQGLGRTSRRSRSNPEVQREALQWTSSYHLAVSALRERTMTIRTTSYPRLLVAVAVCGLVPALVGTATHTTVLAQSEASRVTFSKDIAPMLQRSCQNCHRPQ